MRHAPIVLFVYNRPLHTRITLEALSNNSLAKESTLYIYSDGPKNDATDLTLQKIIETREIIRQQKWCKEVHIIESDKNSGLANSIVRGITEIVNQYGSVIVLEDDIKVSPYFLSYMNDGLSLYKNESKVISIHGYNYPIDTSGLPETFFIKGADCWGWATWADKWKLLDTNSGKLLEKIEKSDSQYEFDIQDSYPYTQMLRNQRDKKINSWAICWYASAFLNDKYTLYPKISVVYNTGLDSSGTHRLDYDNLNSDEWNNSKPVRIDHSQSIETNHLAFSRWKDYHIKNNRTKKNDAPNMFRMLRTFGARIYRKFIRNNKSKVPLTTVIWSGNYRTWEAARNKSAGYDADNILEKVKMAILKVKNGEAAFERDSVVFDKLEYSIPLLDTLINFSLENSGSLEIIDFGGSLGSLYFQYRSLLKGVNDLKWKVVEQSHFVNCGKEFIEDERLKFYYSIDEAIKMPGRRILILSSVLQYLEKPFEHLVRFLKNDFEYIIVDKTAIINTNKSRITVQTIPESIYRASYPAWFFNKEEFLEYFRLKYNLVSELDPYPDYTIDLKDAKGEYKGFIFKLKG